MTNVKGSSRVLGSLRAVDGKGAVRIEDRFDTDIDDLWSALTEPARLARWIGEVEGDLRPGGEFRARFFASGWEGIGRVEACEPPHRFVIWTKESDSAEPDSTKPDSKEAEGPAGHTIEVTLSADGDRTVLVLDERGMPLEQVAGYGAGTQMHIEHLATYLAGRERSDMEARWAELLPAYQALTVDDGSLG